MQHSVMITNIEIYNPFYAILNADGVRQSTSAQRIRRHSLISYYGRFELYVNESLSLDCYCASGWFVTFF